MHIEADTFRYDAPRLEHWLSVGPVILQAAGTRAAELHLHSHPATVLVQFEIRAARFIARSAQIVIAENRHRHAVTCEFLRSALSSVCNPAVHTGPLTAASSECSFYCPTPRVRLHPWE